MVVRNTDSDGLLRKLRYAAVERIVAASAVPEGERLALPEAMLQPAFWADRESCVAYGSSPARGK
jgi:hypothetical protein